MPKHQTERQMQAKTLLRDGDYSSIRDMLRRINRMIPSNPILAEIGPDKQLVQWNAHEVYEEVMALGEGLLQEGFSGAHIAIISGNCVRYIMADMAVSCGVGVVTPIDAEAPASQMAMLLQKCDATAVFCDSAHLEAVQQAQKEYPGLQSIILFDNAKEGLSYDSLLESGRKVGQDGPYHTLRQNLDAPAKILFTSGTTGANKGVVLTSRNLAANMINCMDTIMATRHNTSMSVLPMHHATEINTHIMARVGSGRLTYICHSMRTMMNDIKVFQPDVITIVPMIASAFYRNIMAGVRKAGKEEKLQKGIKLVALMRKFGVDISHKLFPDVFAPFGGNLNMIVCGGAMLNPKTIKGLTDLGIRVENGYGITECGPLISMNGDTLKDHLSVGRPCPGLHVKILNPDENGVGELCVRGASVSAGYYKDPEATAKVFTPDGWFNTGDSAKINPDGSISLMGRKKNTIVLESGKNICPEEVENVIETELDYADSVVFYQASITQGGATRSVLCAGVYIKDEAVRARREKIQKDFERINEKLPAYKRVDYVELPDTDYEKTSTRKIRRASLPTTCTGEGIILL